MLVWIVFGRPVAMKSGVNWEMALQSFTLTLKLSLKMPYFRTYEESFTFLTFKTDVPANVLKFDAFPHCCIVFCAVCMQAMTHTLLLMFQVNRKLRVVVRENRAKC